MLALDVRTSLPMALVALLGWQAGKGEPYTEPVRTSPASDETKQPAPDVPQGRRIVDGDKLRIQVYGQDDLSLEEVRVPLDGRFTYPALGTLVALGKTPRQLEEEIRTGLEERGLVRGARVGVLVTEFQPRRVYLLDGVRRPRDYDLPEGRDLRLTQVLAMAGGFLETADRRRITIIRRHDDGRRELIRVDGEDILLRGQIEKDLIVQEDDTIIVGIEDDQEERIYVAGRVQKPGAYDYRVTDGCTVLQAIVHAGGFAKYADEATVIVIRTDRESGRRRHIKVNIGEVLSGHPEKDIALTPSDIVVVPESFF